MAEKKPISKSYLDLKSSLGHRLAQLGSLHCSLPADALYFETGGDSTHPKSKYRKAAVDDVPCGAL